MGELYVLPDGPQQEMRDKMLSKYNWSADKEEVAPDPENHRFEWVDVMPTPETPLGEWEDWILGFDGVDYVSIHANSGSSCNVALEEVFSLTESGRQGRSLRKSMAISMPISCGEVEACASLGKLDDAINQAAVVRLLILKKAAKPYHERPAYSS